MLRLTRLGMRISAIDPQMISSGVSHLAAMEGMISIRCRSSEARVGLEGAYVARLTLGGAEVIEPTRDGNQTHGGIAVLMPYAGRIRDGRYVFEGASFSLPVAEDGSAIHGFAKDSLWRPVAVRRDRVILECLLEGPGYPGILDARVTYSVRPESFSTDCAVTNVGARSCPFVAGFHPYFKAGDWKLSASGRAYRYELADRYFPTGERARFSLAKAGPKTSLDDAFRVAGAVRLRDERRTLVITRRRMPYLVIYNGQHAEGGSVAVEPYTGLDDAYNNGIGLAVLRPGQSLSFGYRVRLVGRP